MAVQEALAFENERKNACVNALWFLLFSAIYVYVLDLQFRTKDSFAMTKVPPLPASPTLWAYLPWMPFA
eukprot:COSAG05_NODE_1276_length_5305_cov_7.675759_2_plen_69_part_00